MPWHITSKHSGCSGWAVVKDADDKVVGCHPTKAKALAQLAALNMHATSLPDPGDSDAMQERFDGNAAMTACSSAACYRSICAGRRAGDPELRSTWALPHHNRQGGPPDPAGVRNALARLPQTQGLTNRAEAKAHLERHLREINGGENAMAQDGVIRAIYPGVEVREDAQRKMPTLVGYFARFDEWAEIDSEAEGHFMERIAPGAFQRTFAESVPKVLFQHGRDPQIGDKVLGIPDELTEDDKGARYTVPMFDTSYNRDLIPGLKAGAYGASFRFRVEADDMNYDAKPSRENPAGLPERTITEASVMEFGPVTFPAYANATAGVRSLTDEFAAATVEDGIAEYARERPGQLAKIIEASLQTSTTTTASGNAGVSVTTTTNPGTEDKPREDKASAHDTERSGMDIDRFTSLEQLAERDSELAGRAEYLNAEYTGQQFPTEVQTEWDELRAEREAIAERMKHLRDRETYLASLADKDEHREQAVPRRAPDTTRIRKGPENIYDLAGYRAAASSPEQETQLLRDGAMRSIETTDIPLKVSREDGQTKAAQTVGALDRRGELAAYLLAVGSPTYRLAFGKFANAAPAVAMLSPQEAASVEQAKGYAERAFTLGSTGLPVPYQLDPTVIPISNFSVNPFRAISRVESTTLNEWRGATSAGITAAYAAEGTEASDNTPTLAQPTILAQRAQAFVPFSIEVGQDWGAIEAEMGREVADAKDDLEATKFTLGSGTNEPFGLITGATTLVATTTTAAFVIADLYKMEEALPPRFRPRASIIGNRFVLNKVRQFDTSGGSGVWLDVPGLSQQLDNQVPTPGNVRQRILGYPTYENSAMDAVLTTGSEILVMGDFRYFIIVDRVGMSADLIPHLVGTNHRPTGQRGLYFFWRNGSKVVNAAAFRTLQT